MGEVGLKECFTIAGTRSDGLLLVPNNKRCNNSEVLKISTDLLLGLCPGSRFAYLVYISYCTAQKKWICHISQNFEEEAWAKEMKGRRVWLSQKVWPYSLLFLTKFLVLVEPITFLRWSREKTFPANLNGPLFYETCY